MKIQAILSDVVVPSVIERLMLIGIDDIVVSTVRGSSHHAEMRSFRGVRYSDELIERSMIECWPDDDQGEAVGRAIQQAIEKSGSEAFVVVSLTL